MPVTQTVEPPRVFIGLANLYKDLIVSHRIHESKKNFWAIRRPSGGPTNQFFWLEFLFPERRAQNSVKAAGARRIRFFSCDRWLAGLRKSIAIFRKLKGTFGEFERVIEERQYFSAGAGLGPEKRGVIFYNYLVLLYFFGGESGIRTRGTPFGVHSLSRRAP